MRNPTSFRHQLSVWNPRLRDEKKVGLLRVTVCPRENRLAVQHALPPGESTPGIATVLRRRGTRNLKILLNGRDAVLGTDGSLNLGSSAQRLFSAGITVLRRHLVVAVTPAFARPATLIPASRRVAGPAARTIENELSKNK